MPTMLDKISSADFSPYLNQRFRIDPEASEPLDVELIEVSELGSASISSDDPEKRRPFSIVFRGPNDPSLPQGIYDIEHGEMGTLSLFIVPIGPDKEGMLYHAVFN